MTETTETTETKAAFARRLEVSRPRVTQLVRRGDVLTDQGGRVRVEASLNALRAAGKLPQGVERADAGANRNQDVAEAAARHASDPFEAGAMTAASAMARNLPQLAACAAVDAGCSEAVAREIFNTAADAAVEMAGRWLSDAGISACQNGGDPPIWQEPQDPVWEKLAFDAEDSEGRT